jgi:SNF2 family DNA or RNA helicase
MTSPSVSRKSLEPWIKDDVQYYPHQVDGVRTLIRRRSFLLADDMGLGKSIEALTVFGVDVKLGLSTTAIIICPVTLKGNWADEIEKFTRFPYVVLDGTPRQRSEQLLDFFAILGPKILIVNYEQVKAHYDQINSFKFDVAIFDEAHYLKNPKAQRTKACLEVHSNRSFMLTGTPMLNKVDELWTILHRIDPAAYPRYWSFVNRYAVFGGYKDKQIIGVKNERELTERLQDVMLRRLKDDVLGLPEVQYIERRVDLLPEQRKLYDEVALDLKLPRPDLAEPEDIENALTKFLRLKQICGTTLPFTGVDVSAKLDLATEDDMELLSNGHRIVVFTQFRDVQAAYVERMRPHGLPIFQLHGDVPANQRQDLVKQWAATTEPGIIVCMLQVAGVGLNMTAARHGSFLDELFVPGLNQQAVDRMHRIGQSETQSVQIRRYITRKTIENRIQAILRNKKKLNREIVESDPTWKKRLYDAMASEDD